jgi:CubicO group peptidase (beta-lactamase class C family)
VSRRGEVVFEQYYNATRRDRPANIKSASKSVIAMLVGIAVDRKLIAGVKEPIARYFPELRRDPDPRKLQITIEHLLTMRSGLVTTSFDNYGAWVGSRNWIGYVLEKPLEADPGESMEYSTGNTHLVSAILTQAARRSTWAFAQEALGRPLGFTVSRWPRDPQGIYFGGNDMLMTPRQMLSFGELYLNRGRVNGRQVVPAEWIEASFVARTQSRWSDQLYGYGWWVRDLAGHEAYFAWGYGGQYVFVLPDLDLVIVTTSATSVSDERRGHRRTIFDLIERFVVEPIAARDDA